MLLSANLLETLVDVHTLISLFLESIEADALVSSEGIVALGVLHTLVRVLLALVAVDARLNFEIIYHGYIDSSFIGKKFAHSIGCQLELILASALSGTPVAMLSLVVARERITFVVAFAPV